MFKLSVTVFLAAFAVFSSMGPALAQQKEPRALGTFKDWLAYSWVENGHKVCYMLSRPTKSTPQNVNRDDIYLMVTFRPQSKSKEEVSHIAGYPYKDQSTVDIAVGNSTFVLATNNDVAWVPENESDEKLVRAMRSGAKLVVTGKSERGTVTTDTYSLQGFTAAHRQIRKSCT
ncbi:invasion associated locus B family protein [Sneathiella sp.]|uniref:invasion associated locus B family protein n=1 Tax=Sneathiella sp. TaxID=1964365 RepID=UPI003563726A